MNQNLSSYRIFYTVANTGNISKAAKELYISQPAISKSIQKLEESVGCKLFSRSSRGVVLTDEGKLLYEHVSEAVSYTHLDVYKRQTPDNTLRPPEPMVRSLLYQTCCHKLH